MAGSVAKILGGLLVVFGSLLLIVGIIVASSGANNERDNQEQLLQDDERSRENEVLVAGGIAAGGVGIVLLITGIILVVVGSARQEKQVVAAVTPAASKGRGRVVDPIVPASPGSSTATRNGLAVAFVVIVLGLITFFLVIGGRPGLFDENQSELVLEDDYTGALRLGSPLGTGDPEASNIVEFTSDPRTDRLVATINWTASEAGSNRLRVMLEVYDGGWSTLASATGTGPLIMDVTDVGLANRDMRLVVSAPENTLVLQQTFTLNVEYWAIN